MLTLCCVVGSDMGDRLLFLFNMPFRVKKRREQNKMNSKKGAPNNSAQLGNAERKRKFVSYTKRECLIVYTKRTSIATVQGHASTFGTLPHSTYK
jgi:hypothetical protein